ncbi:MAG: phosphotransferase [Streptosporangiaceae bacterium]
MTAQGTSAPPSAGRPGIPRPDSFRPGVLRAVWRRPLYRSGHALVVNSGLTALLGVLYWVIAARTYPVKVVGENTAAVSAMMFLAGIAQLNLTDALLRFVPSAGARALRVIRAAYLAGAGLAALAALVFLAGLDVWAPDLSFLTLTPLVAGWFVVSAAGWAIFTMQDGVLTAVGKAAGVPIENLVFSLVKVGLVVVFVALLPREGIFVSWTVAMAVAMLGTNAYLFGRAIPAHMRTAQTRRAENVTLRGVSRFVLWDYVGSLFWLAAIWALPIVILDLVGAAQTAVFTMAWNIAYTFYLVPMAMGQSLVAHATSGQAEVERDGRAVLAHTLRLLLPVVAVLVIVAPFALEVFGARYSEHGTMVLRLLLLSAIPNAVTALAVSEARVRRRMRVVVSVLGSLCALVYALSLFLMPMLGITGVGVAWLCAEIVVAAAVLVTRGRNGRAGASLPTLPQLAPVIVGLRDLPTRRRRAAVIRGLGPSLLARVPSANGDDPARWGIRRVLSTVSDTTVAVAGSERHPCAAVVKLTMSPEGSTLLSRQKTVLAALHNDDALGEWRRLLPRVLAAGTVDDRYFTVESGFAAVDGRTLLHDTGSLRQLVGSAVDAIGELHRRTSAAVRVDDALLDRWVYDRADQVRDALAVRAGDPRAGVDKLTCFLGGELAGRRVAVAWTHGDYCLGNILVAPGGTRVAGIVDWGQAMRTGMPALDPVTFLLATAVQVSGSELGTIVAERLSDRPWSADEQRVLAAAQECLPGEPLGGRALLLLGWLHHVTANLTKSPSYAANRYWLRHNVEAVLRILAHE